MLFVFTRRRLTLVVGAVAGLAVAVSGIAVCAAMMRSPDYAAFRAPTFYAHGGELPKLLRLSDQLTSAGADYESSYQQALTGLDTLIGAAAGGRPVTSTESFLVGSDIHANWLTLPAFTSTPITAPPSSSAISPTTAPPSRRRSPDAQPRSAIPPSLSRATTIRRY